MGKVIEFKKFSKKINKDNLNIKDSSLDMFPENDLAYVRKEIQINLTEIDSVISCIHNQILINDVLISTAEKENDYQKLTYMRDFNDKLYDVMYFLTMVLV